jgi:hypothetical protein
MRKRVAWLLLGLMAMLSLGGLFAQNVVSDTTKVKRPVHGKLYFSKKDTNYYVFTGKGFTNLRYIVNKALPTYKDRPTEGDFPVIDPPGLGDYIETEIGTWHSVAGSVLVAKQVGHRLWLFQTDAKRTFYVLRGKNFLSDKNVILKQTIDPNSLANEVTGLGGLWPSSVAGKNYPDDFPVADMQKYGYVLNDKGEFSKTVGVIEDKPTATASFGSDLVPFVLETKNNTLNLGQFNTLKLPAKFNFVFGFGSPIYAVLGERN